MAKPTVTTLFSGIGGVDLGAIAAGFEPCEAVEFDPQLAELHKANIGGKCHVMNILDCDPFKFEKVDLLHASPVCKSFSSANANKGEKQLDIDCAKKVAEFIQVLQPSTFTLENVQAYGKSKAFNIILEMLYSQGYWVNYQVLNAADFGGIYQCPFHTVNYVQNPYPTATAQVSVEKFATMPSEDQTKHLAWFVAASLVKATKQEYVENVTVQKLLYIAQLLEQRENPTQVGLEVDILMTEGISKSVLTGNISESIDMLLKECLAENSQRQKLSITSMETKQTIVRTIYKCLRITLNTSDIIVQKHDECPLCKRYGVPQSRRRLILIAVKSGYIPSLPPKQKHVGWYAAIADLVHDLPDSQLADWQIKALPSEISCSTESMLLLRDTKFTNAKSRKPSPTLTADACQKDYKAILIENTGARSDRELQTRTANEPCWTLRAMGQDGHYHRANALLENAKIKALDIACLARLQSFPDDYKWTGRKSLDGMGIGNSVPPLMYKAISEILKNV
ncbi:MAG: DNA cytosine methyltransferase [Pseudanabaena sp. M172S2SP2A07QC]|nr:DNA cytosine methyltransferase [Pseudanabaena sp. M172S2SP2A07QC]MCA6510276.1 DNA cytosine methyltransferase [Pseudanabaena sp. M109S1SP2A07QC]MCA6546674.1 DNA cytosine methyltransferase [Pseudanabaena sp. M152S2SP2A07QC]